MKKNLLALFITVPGIAFAADKTPAPAAAVAVPRPTAATPAAKAAPAAAVTKSAETAAAAKPTGAAVAPVKPVEEADKSQPKPNKDISDKEPKKRGFSFDGYSFGLGVGVLGGVDFNLGYRIPYNPDHFWLNRLGFRLDLNTFAPISSMLKRIPDDMAKSYIDENRKNGRIEINDESHVYADDVTFNTRLSGTNFGALVDFYPFSYTWGLGGLRFSGGYYFGSLKLGFDAKALGIKADFPDDLTSDFSIGDITLGSVTIEDMNMGAVIEPSGTAASISKVSASPMVKLNASGPYLGLGWDIGLFYGLKFTFDAGVVFTDPHKLSMDMYIADPNLGNVTINLGKAADELEAQLINAVNAKFDACGAACTSGDRSVALAAIPGQVNTERGKLYDQIVAELNKNNVPFTGDPDNKKTIKVDGAEALRAADAGDSVEKMKAEIYRVKDDAIREFNTQVKDYGYFPMVKIGFIYRF